MTDTATAAWRSDAWADARDAYDTACNAARDAYDTACDDAWDAYYAVCDDAWAAYNAALDAPRNRGYVVTEGNEQLTPTSAHQGTADAWADADTACREKLHE